MPAAIRVDIHIGSFRDSAESSKNSSLRLEKIARVISEEVQRVLQEETNVTQDEVENTLTTNNMFSVVIKEGLGPPWPNISTESKPQQIGEGISEYLELLKSGNIPEPELALTESYDDGAFRIYISLNLG